MACFFFIADSSFKGLEFRIWRRLEGHLRHWGFGLLVVLGLNFGDLGINGAWGSGFRCLRVGLRFLCEVALSAS